MESLFAVVSNTIPPSMASRSTVNVYGNVARALAPDEGLSSESKKDKIRFLTFKSFNDRPFIDDGVNLQA